MSKRSGQHYRLPCNHGYCNCDATQCSCGSPWPCSPERHYKLPTVENGESWKNTPCACGNEWPCTNI